MAELKESISKLEMDLKNKEGEYQEANIQN